MPNIYDLSREYNELQETLVIPDFFMESIDGLHWVARKPNEKESK